MQPSDWVNVAAIIIAPIISVIIGQYLQDRAKKREDKIRIFQTLMTERGILWSYKSVEALNSIEIVFAKNTNVRSQWKKYFDKLSIQNPSPVELQQMEVEKVKLLEVMANSLGYKGKVTWEIIESPYIPKWLSEQIRMQQQNMNNQTEIFSKMNTMMSRNNQLDPNPSQGKDEPNGQISHGNPGPDSPEH